MQQASILINNKEGISMKVEFKIAWIFGIVSIMTGCASVNDNPYHRIWHSPIYETQNSSVLAMGEYAVPIAEGANIGMGVNTLLARPLIEEGAYALESDPFRSYATPSLGRRAGQASINSRFLSSH